MSLLTSFAPVFGELRSDESAQVGSFAADVASAVHADDGDRLQAMVKTAMASLADDRSAFLRLIGALNYAETYGTPTEKTAVARLLPLVKSAMRELDAERALAKHADAHWAQVGIGAAGLALGAAPFMSHMLHRSARETKIKTSFSRILQDHPELRGDPNTPRYFQAVVDFAPDVAANALVAGNVLKTMHQIGPGAVTPKMIAELLQVQTGYDDRPTGGKLLGEASKAVAGANRAVGGGRP